MSSYCDLQWGMRAAEKDSSAFVKCTKNRDYFKQVGVFNFKSRTYHKKIPELTESCYGLNVITTRLPFSKDSFCS